MKTGFSDYVVAQQTEPKLARLFTMPACRLTGVSVRASLAAGLARGGVSLKLVIILGLIVIVTLQADADPRVGTKACVVENAHRFSPQTGQAGAWANDQKSFVLTVYACDDAKARGIDFANEEACKHGWPNTLGIKTTITGWEDYWDSSPASGPQPNNIEHLLTVPAEFRTIVMWLPAANRPIFRLYPDLRFEFIRIASTESDPDGMNYIYTLTGTCADLQ